jgi:phosphoglucosamine mutase
LAQQLFGTDGIRGRAGSWLTPELALRAASGFARQLSPEAVQRRLQVAVGSDSRLSSPMLKAAVISGLCLQGVDVIDLGIVPTPLVPFAILRLKLGGGVMITASHNPVADNGIKFFGRDGLKIGAAGEAAVQAAVESLGQHSNAERIDFGSVTLRDVEEDYLNWACKVAGTGLPALRVVLDCAHGATSRLAPLAFERCGFVCEALHASFDGARVNVASGATDLRQLSRRVVQSGADLGLGFDGDGDRVLAVDAGGAPVSGDKIIALFATRLPRYRNQRGVVMTQMTNMGVEEALARRGVAMRRTDVGDAKVLAEMMASGLNLGGEQSGHIIMRDKLPAGDGILAGLQLAALLARSGKPLRELVAEFAEYPQQLTNLQVRDRAAWMRDKRVGRRIEAAKNNYPDVRFYIRPSGTENLLRVLTEARDQARCLAANAALCDVFTTWDAA